MNAFKKITALLFMFNQKMLLKFCLRTEYSIHTEGFSPNLIFLYLLIELVISDITNSDHFAALRQQSRMVRVWHLELYFLSLT